MSKQTALRVVGQVTNIIEEAELWLQEAKRSVEYHTKQLSQEELSDWSKEYHTKKLAEFNAVVLFLGNKLDSTKQIQEHFLKQAIEG